jgi:glycerate 2-kinase
LSEGAHLPAAVTRGAQYRSAPRQLLLDCFQAALRAVDARHRVRDELLRKGSARGSLQGDWHVIAVGKAAGAMALGAFDALGDRIVAACVITPPGHVPAELNEYRGSLALLQGGHPVPDASSLGAGAELVRFVRSLPPRARVLCLVSGGASSLVEHPVADLTLADVQRVGSWALASGWSIEAVNAVRRQLSQLKGGGLANLLGERQALALMVSDVPLDDPRTIGSGLLHASPAASLPEPGVPADVAAILQRAARSRAVQAGREKPVPYRIVASRRMACAAAASVAKERGCRVRMTRRRLQGDAAQAGLECAQATLRLPDRMLRIWAGETTVVLPAHPGRGGRNQHLALNAACALAAADCADAWLLAAGTDGIDGGTDDAGALVDAGTCARGRDAGLDWHDALAAADSGTFLEAAGDLLHTGATLTNVGDMVLGLRWRAEA